MALVVCQECEKEVSDKAASCPNCGCPIGTLEVCKEMEKKKKGSKKYIWIIIVAIIALCGVLLYIQLSNRHTRYVKNIIEADLETSVECDAIYYSEKGEGYVVYFTEEDGTEDVATIDKVDGTVGYKSVFELYSLMYTFVVEEAKTEYAELLISCGYETVWASNVMLGTGDWKLVE